MLLCMYVQEEQVKDSGKSSAIVAKMIEGKVSKFITENTLLEQSLSTVSDNPTVRCTAFPVCSATVFRHRRMLKTQCACCFMHTP
jgi:translation elongation factor EF-Ts